MTTLKVEDRMPPAGKGVPLKDDEVRRIREWIVQGAEYAEHWAFRKPNRPGMPEVAVKEWVRTPVDAFILRRLEAERLAPAPEAGREVQVRRVYLDVTGLPPSPEDIRGFVDDPAPDAYERLVDRLLASPAYGERWGRHWLDVARYADSGGFETDLFFAHAWRYRDYVIGAFNSDKPFDQFVREQVAGDELDPAPSGAAVATGFYTVGPVLQESGMVPGKLEYDQLTDAVDTTCSTFLGLTAGCARCHDHKYDPLSQREYFGLQAIFSASDQFDVVAGQLKPGGRAALNNTLQAFELEQARGRARRESDPAARDRLLEQIGQARIQRDDGLRRRLERSTRFQELERAFEQYRRELDRGRANSKTAPSTVRVDELRHEIGRRLLEYSGKTSEWSRAYGAIKEPDAQRRFLIQLATTNACPEKPDGYITDAGAFRREQGLRGLNDAGDIPVRVLAHRPEPLAVHVLKRGELEKPGERVAPGFPARLGAPPRSAGGDPRRWRAGLAEWITSRENPLTARVLVNRVWQWHFGPGLVRTPNDFGLRGERPSHPELLDWLAVELMDHGWSLKHLHRVILLSSVFRMASTPNPAAVGADPENRLLGRFPSRRLEAEVVWDAMLSAAGTLNLDMGGLSMAPPLDDQEQIGNFLKWPASSPAESHRRAVYLLIRRSFRFPMLSAFDLPDNIASCGRRDVTSIPNQSLTLLNSRIIHDRARDFAARLVREAEGKPVDWLIERAWLYAYSRRPEASERERVLSFLDGFGPSGNGAGDPVLVTAGMRPAMEHLCLALLNTSELIYLP